MNEALKLQVKDIDFAQQQLKILDAQGRNIRVTILPPTVVEPLNEQLQHAKCLHGQDLSRGCGSTELPFALARKYPGADLEWVLQYVFPSHRLSQAPEAIQFEDILNRGGM